VQLWVALPAAARDVAPAFEHHASLPVLEADGARTTVVMGTLSGAASPATTYSPLVGADVELAGGADLELAVESDFEHAVLVTEGHVTVAGRPVPRGTLLYLPPGPSRLPLAADEPARAMLVGGVPFAERIVMWWNFVGADHDDVARAREQWQAADVRFGTVHGYDGGRLAAPALPNARLRPRGRTREE
jgi:hypothetical protein